MSNLSNCVRDVATEFFDGNQSKMAKHCGVPQLAIYRLCSGLYRPDPERLDTICAHLDASAATRLAVAHLLDECPKTARYRVTIKASEDDGAIMHDVKDSAVTRLDKRTRKAIEFIAEKSVSDPNGRAFLISTAQALGAKLP